MDSGTTPGKAVRDRAANAGGPEKKSDGDGGGRSAKGAAPTGGAQPGDAAQGQRGDTKSIRHESIKHDAAIERVAAKQCPKGIDLAQCEALAKDAEQTKNAPSYTVTTPEDCLKTMSRGECEALYAAQKQAAEANGASVDVQACLRNPTPECEAVVRPFAEQQQAAEEAGR